MGIGEIVLLGFFVWLAASAFYSEVVFFGLDGAQAWKRS